MVGAERIDELEARMEAMERRVRAVERGRIVELRAPRPVASATEPRPAPEPRTAAPPRKPRVARLAAPAVPDLEQLLGGRVLAWLGGAAVFVGLALLLALAIASGWLGGLARTGPAGGRLGGGARAQGARGGRLDRPAGCRRRAARAARSYGGGARGGGPRPGRDLPQAHPGDARVRPAARGA